MTTTMRTILIAGLLAGVLPRAAAQAPDTVLRKELPRLEIPEITIVGKKAITLPFARKGEIYDVPVYEAPPPDSGLLTGRPEIDLPPGSLPRYEQRENPWRLSAEGSAGRFGSFGFLGYVDYHTQQWNLSTTGGYSRTDGHVPNSEGDKYEIGGRYSALVTTDNDFLRNFRLNGDVGLRHDAFGMPGALPSGTDRDRDMYRFGAGFSSVKREGLVMDFSVAADIFKVNDEWGGIDSGVTVTSPVVDATVAGDAGAFRLITGFKYTSSSLDYPNGGASPYLYTLLGAMQWTLADGFFLRAGGEYSGGSGTDDISRNRVSPRGELEWRLDAGRRISLWFRPGMTLTNYTDLASRVPYLAREIAMIPETKTLDMGGSVWYNSGMLTLELSGGYSQSDNRPLLVTDSGRIRTEFAGTWESRIGVDGTLRPGPALRVRFNGAFSPSRERGGNSQLPMSPVAEAGGQAELDLTGWWTLSAAARYWTKQNIDRAGSRSIGSALVLDAGVSTTLIPHVLLSGGIRNLLDKEYEWWSGYPARGMDFYVTAKARL